MGRSIGAVVITKGLAAIIGSTLFFWGIAFYLVYFADDFSYVFFEPEEKAEGDDTTASFDLPSTTIELIELYQARGIIPVTQDGWRPLKLIACKHRGSKLNDDYCLRPAGLRKTIGIVPHLCRDFQTDMLWTN